MKFKCKECGAKTGVLDHGRCPACGSGRISANVSIRDENSKTSSEAAKNSSAFKKALLIALWLLLAYKAYEILFAGA